MCVRQLRRDAMRVANFLITAIVFSILFIGVALLSAVATSSLHAQISSKALPFALQE
jgi:hypothetical protein